MTQKTKILTLTGYYLPGYKSGGPLRTIVNMVEHLSDEFEFWIITKDRDLGDSRPYPDIQPNAWQSVGKAMVYYLSPTKDNLNHLARLIVVTAHDILYLNSFFDPFGTIRPLLARKCGMLSNKPVVLAPRGEFSPGALQLKYLKKFLYIKAARLLGLYRNLTWQASSEFEAEDIIWNLGVPSAFIHIAMDLPAPVTIGVIGTAPTDAAEGSLPLRIVFLSRISPKKNLDYALVVLQKVTIPISFDIYGPAEDADYWQQCQELIKQLPYTITVSYKGSVAAEQVRSVFSRYDLFFFPTRGENYGHVIAESLSVGTPVLLSDQTPWRNLADDRFGWDLSLNSSNSFVEKINICAQISSTERYAWRTHIKEKIVARLSDPLVFEANRELFRNAIKQPK